MNAPTRTSFATRPYPADAEITIRGLKKLFGGSPVYEDFDLDVPKGAIVSVFGPNGCGKSTLINIVSGLMPHDGGQILFDGKTIAETRLAYVFQNYREALFPWLKSIDNIRYPLKLMGLPRKEQDIRIERLLAAMEVKFDLDRYPYELSGGQQQTISIMRALVVEPEVLFLDEPFSALDYEMTLSMRDRLQRVFIETGVTMMLVSHDLEEAIYMADRILLLTRRPTRIAAYLEFDAPRPRTATTLTDPAFITLKRECLEIFQREVRG
jgi:NitT/TauT family transport system ATP-binding protein